MIEAAGEIASDAAESPHVPVLAAEALQALAVAPAGFISTAPSEPAAIRG